MAGFIDDDQIVTLGAMYEYPTPPTPKADSFIDRLLQHRTAAIGVIIVIAVVGGLIGLTVGSGGDGDETADQAPAESTDVDTTVAPTTSVGTDSPDEGGETAGAGESASSEIPDEEDPLAPGTGTGPGEGIEPVEPPAPSPEELIPATVNPLADACAAALAEGENLIVRPDVQHLPPGDTVGSFEVHNCGNGAVDWTASTVPWVNLDDAGGTIGGGESFVLGYGVATDDLGAFDFKLKVSEPGHNTYVDVDGFREAVGRDFQAGGGSFTAGAGAGGCNNSCITSALLSDNATTPDLTLRVKLDTPAMVNVWVHTEEPVQDADGDPSFPGVGLAGFTSGFETDWTTTLGNLAWATDYFIIVEAIDENGGVSYRSGEFRTRSAGAGIDGGFTNSVDAGCSLQCILTGTVVPDPDFSNDVEVVATSDTGARWTLWISPKQPELIDGVPTVSDEWEIFTTPGYSKSFAREVDDLEFDRTYFVVLRATDDSGRSSYQSGSFTTGEELRALAIIRILRAEVTNDADGVGRGEITLYAGGSELDMLRTGEQRLGDGHHVHFEPGQGAFEILVTRDGWLPNVVLTMYERDEKLPPTFDIVGGLTTERGSTNDKHFWNGTSTGLTQVQQLDTLARCSDYGITNEWADQACVKVATTNTYGDQFPGFEAIVGFTILTDYIYTDSTKPQS